MGRIIDCYQSPSFGYASMNFYAEFLAALELLQKHRERSTPQLAQNTAQIATQSYRVRRGDTLIQLSRKFRTTPQDLMMLNNLTNPHRLVAGTMILVPRG